MKKINKIFSIAAIASIITISFTACFDPALYQLNQDVVSETAVVSGSINSIARYTVSGKEYLVLAGGEESSVDNRGLLYKVVESDENADSNNHGKWKVLPESSLPFKDGLHHYDYYGTQGHLGEQILKVLAGPEYLYIVSTTYKNNSTLGTSCSDEINIYAIKVTDWETVTKADWVNLLKSGDDRIKRSDGIDYLPLYDTSKYTYSAFNVFSTNAPIASNRSVYIRSGNNSSSYPTKYYKIDGTVITEITTPITFLKGGKDSAGNTNLVATNTTETTDELINTVVSVNGSEIFFSDSQGVTTNETYTTPATIYYASLNGYVCYGTSYSDSHTTINLDCKIASLAYCKDVLLIGRGNYDSAVATSDAGIDKVDLTNDIPGTTAGKFETNAQSQLLSSYIVMILLNATPDKTELNSTLYASVNFVGTASSTQATFKNIGLWSYYPKRGNWNKE